MNMIKIKDILYPVDAINSIEFYVFAQYGRFCAQVTLKSDYAVENRITVENHAAIDLAMRFGPEVLEGNPDFKFAKHVWAFHNLIAHPLMQILAFFGLTKLGLKIHDSTIPRPRIQ
jgi:hypothetical protein